MGLSLFFATSLLYPLVFLSPSRHTGRPNSPVSSFQNTPWPSAFYIWKSRFGLTSVCRDKMRERERERVRGSEREEKRRWSEWEPFRLKKKKKLAVRPCCWVGVGSLRNHLAIIFFLVSSWHDTYKYIKHIDIWQGLKWHGVCGAVFVSLFSALNSCFCTRFPSWTALKRWIHIRTFGQIGHG